MNRFIVFIGIRTNEILVTTTEHRDEFLQEYFWDCGRDLADYETFSSADGEVGVEINTRASVANMSRPMPSISIIDSSTGTTQ